MPSPRAHISALFTSNVLAGSLLAETALPPKIEIAIPPAKVSIIALGPKPIRRYKRPTQHTKDPRFQSQNTSSRSRQTILLGAPKYSTPPTQLFFKIHGNTNWQLMDVRFNNQGVLKKIPALKTIDFHSTIPMVEGQNPTIRLPAMEPSSNTLFFLTPAGELKSLWKNNPRVTAVPLTWSATGGTRILLINTSKQVVTISISQGKIFPLNPGQQKRVDLNSHAVEMNIKLIAKGANDTKISLQESILVRPSITKVYAFYSAAPMTNGGRTLACFRAIYQSPK